MLTQETNWQADEAMHLQQNQLLTCLSGTFSGSQRNWSIIEKEAYPIICANLIYVFAPRTEVKKHIRGKLLR
ncbi:hypothetical protein PHMEG_0007578 [Phytophthora megakarya]|uniref:Uncharacterized protein n=1 Tax=Phytophthora megakarya TaxID=4795 RepID=A0A225WL03_9STRA|nr:hypothetical protein PHMEG_0007578 [Phytophthora megakarya]